MHIKVAVIMYYCCVVFLVNQGLRPQPRTQQDAEHSLGFFSTGPIQ